ncbi:IS110 family transposase [Nocardia sp. IFM 10818]
MSFVCVQPAMTAWSRRAEDLTSNKADDKDAVLIARLTAQLRCHMPEPVDETWGRLRGLGARRDHLIVGGGDARDLRDSGRQPTPRRPISSRQGCAFAPTVRV